MLARLAKVDVLILDDWGLAPLGDQQRRDVLKILEDRHALRATVVTSQVPIENSHDYIAHPTIADAVLDRLVHNGLQGQTKGPSHRKEKAPLNQPEPSPVASLRSRCRIEVITMRQSR